MTISARTPLGALTSLDEEVGKPEALNDEGSRLRFSEEKVVGGTRVVAFSQTHRGIPVWQSGASIVLQDAPTRVTSGTNEFRYEVEVDDLDDDAKYTPSDTTNIRRALSRLLGKGRSVEQLTSTRFVIYQYDPERRFPFLAGMDDRDPGQDVGVARGSNKTAAHTLSVSTIAKLPDDVEAGRDVTTMRTSSTSERRV